MFATSSGRFALPAQSFTRPNPRIGALANTRPTWLTKSIPPGYSAWKAQHQSSGVEDPELVVSAIESFLATVQREEEEFDRVLATVLFTDTVGSTEKASEVGDHAWEGIVERHHAATRAFLGR
jgi:hypothetical protein